MGSEKQTWRNLKVALDKMQGLHYQRFEDALAVGVPDLMICKNKTIFVELKQRDRFPVRSTTHVRLGFKSAQYLWLCAHQKAGGLSMLLAQVGREYFMFDRVEFLAKLMMCAYTEKEFRAHARAFKNAADCMDYLMYCLDRTHENSLKARRIVRGE